MSDSSSDDLIETRLRVVGWNIWWRYGPWQRRQAAIETTLKALDPDVIALQEVWDDGTTSSAAILAEALGREFVYQRSEMREGIGFGNAILSRWPIARSDWRPLPGRRESREGRSVIFAEIEGPRGPLQVFATHLNWRFDHSHIRQQQVTEVARFIVAKGARDMPPILCGDFNADPDSDEMRMMTGLAAYPVPGLALRDAWWAAGNEARGYTWDNKNDFAAGELEPNRRIDYILVGEPGVRGAGHVVDCRVAGDTPVDGLWPSDHFAVAAELRY